MRTIISIDQAPIRIYKERSGFGKWATVRVLRCNVCKGEVRLIQRGAGCPPPGGITCPICDSVKD